MAEADGIPPTASVASVGPGIRYIGNHCYAYSGITRSSSGAQQTPLSFTTGNGYIIAELGFAETERGSSAIKIKIYFNDEQIIDNEYDNQPAQDNPAPYPLLIPPFTLVECKWDAGGTNIDGSFWLVGRVYDTS